MRKGIALVTAIIVMALALAMAAAAMYLSVGGLKVSSAYTRYESGLAAADGGISLGINEAVASITESRLPNPQSATISGYSLNVTPDFMGVYFNAGGSIEFASGYEGLGKAAATSGASAFFRIRSLASRGDDRVMVEAVYSHSPQVQ